MSRIGRRIFVKQGLLSLVALGMTPEFLPRLLLADTRGATRKKTLVCIFQRGAVDGLSMVVPFGEEAYYRARRSIAIPAPRRGLEAGVIDLDGFFGLHPALRPLYELYQRRQLGIVHAVGSPHPTRSHFDAQDFMETATPGVKSTRDGWLNRVLTETGCRECAGRTLADPRAHARDHVAGQLGYGGVRALRGIAVGPALPRSLQGEHPALAIPDVESFRLAGGRDPAIEGAFTRLYSTPEADLLGADAKEAFEALDVLGKVTRAPYRPREGVAYPPGNFGRALRQIAQLIKADIGLEVAFAEVGGWDTHVAQGGAAGQLARRLAELAQGIRALHDDLGDRMGDVVILTMSEFGRTVAENGSGGTDHGHATCMLVLGGAVAGGRVHGDWPGLERERLYEGRDLAMTTDFRDVFAEIVARHLGAGRLDRIFPGYGADPRRFRGIISTG